MCLVFFLAVWYDCVDAPRDGAVKGNKKRMKAVITVVGCDSIGIIAGISAECARYGVNISEITQSVLAQYFVMIMIVDIARLTCDFSDFVDAMEKHGRERSLEIHVMHENMFNSMHEI